MFGRRKKDQADESRPFAVIDLTPETREALERFDSDITVLAEMVRELQETHSQVLEVLRSEVAREAAELQGDGSIDQPPAVSDPEPEKVDKKKVPASIAKQKALVVDTLGSDRIRETPFTRSPRSVQIKWLEENVLNDGEWHTAIGAVANDERHFRYLRGALGGRLREMHEDGIVERRDSNVRGSMFEYRLKQP